MVHYKLLGEDAPLAEAFKSKGLSSVSVLISIGAIAGLTTTLLVGLYVQSRLYLWLGRDGLIPSVFAKVHPTRHTPIHSQIWVGIVACILVGLLNVTVLSHILSVGSLAGYSVVAACVLTLRLDDKVDTQISTTSMNYDDLDSQSLLMSFKKIRKAYRWSLFTKRHGYAGIILE